MAAVFGIEFGFNKEKSRVKAEGYLQANKLPNAIAEYEKILKVEPNDLTILNTVGDVYARLGQNEKAIERWKRKDLPRVKKTPRGWVPTSSS